MLDSVKSKEKNNLSKKIKSLNNKDSYLTILQFIINNKVKYTENSNGVFFNLKHLDNSLIIELIDLVNNLSNKQNINLNNNNYVVDNKLDNNLNEDNFNLHINYKKYINNQ